MSAIHFQNVSKAFGGLRAVEECTLAIGDGAFAAILGPSGCGKTTLLRMLGGFLAPDRGRIVVGGRDVTALPPFRRNIGFVFQSYALFPHLTVAENVAFGLRRRGIDRAEAAARVRRYLDLVRLPGVGERYPSQLSGGQQQRVALARALAVEPDVLVLDEPLSALDRKLREQMQAELKTLQRTVGVTTLLVTHDQEEALTMADRVVVMSGGRVEQIGSPHEIYEQPQTRFVADFVGLSNLLEGTLRDGAGGPRFETRGGLLLDVAARNDCAPGEHCGYVVRPERIGVHRERPAAGMHNLLQASVRSVLYQGQQTRIDVAVGDLALTTIEPPRHGDQGALAPGDTVFISLDPAVFHPLAAARTPSP